MNAVTADNHSASSSRTGEWFNNQLWLIKRELWEHRGRFIYTPLVVAAVILIGTIYGWMQVDAHMFKDGEGVHIGTLGGVTKNAPMMKGFHLMALLGFSVPFFIVMLFVQTYYAFDTLYADRRDRSILFWKSLPVSDLETVVSKLSVASLVSPAITFVVSIATQYVVLILTSIVFAAHGQEVMPIWKSIPLFQTFALLIYTLVCVGIWYLPLWSWCMLVSSWAQRAVFLWASVPIAALCFLEYQTLGTTSVANFLRIRSTGMFEVMFHTSPTAAQGFKDGTVADFNLSDFITPSAYFSSPHLWIGLAMTAGFVTATIWMRRYRELG